MSINSPEVDLVYAVIGTFFFWFRNPDKTFIYWISSLLLSLFLSQVLFFNTAELIGQITWALAAASLLIIYPLRLKRKQISSAGKWIKVITLILIVAYPIPFYSLFDWNGYFLGIVHQSTFFVVGTVFIYDRWILKGENVKKKFIIALVVQSVIILLVLMYAFVQHAEAEKQRMEAVRNAESAREEQRKAVEKIKELQDQVNKPDSVIH